MVVFNQRIFIRSNSMSTVGSSSGREAEPGALYRSRFTDPTSQPETDKSFGDSFKEEDTKDVLMSPIAVRYHKHAMFEHADAMNIIRSTLMFTPPRM